MSSKHRQTLKPDSWRFPENPTLKSYCCDEVFQTFRRLSKQSGSINPVGNLIGGTIHGNLSCIARSVHLLVQFSGCNETADFRIRTPNYRRLSIVSPVCNSVDFCRTKCVCYASYNQKDRDTNQFQEHFLRGLKMRYIVYCVCC